MRVRVYVDGFNLYYRALKNAPRYKWLNLDAFCRRFFKATDTIQQISYYTAPVSGKDDPGQPVRQQVYLRALRTIPHLAIHPGTFLRKKIVRPLVSDMPLVYPRASPHMVLVHDTEEKGSDVNLASHLVRDGLLGRFDLAGVISADTDLVEPIRIVTTEAKLPVVLISPDVNRVPGKTLVAAATFVRHVTNSDLAACQFPAAISVAGKSDIRLPNQWV